MILKQSIQKTNNFFHKTLKSLRSFCHGDYQKLPKSPLSSPFHCIHCHSKFSQTKQYSHAEFCSKCRKDIQKAKKRIKNSNITALKEQITVQNASCESSMLSQACNPAKYKPEEPEKKEKKLKASFFRRREEESSQNRKRAGSALAKKMKELDMVDLGDVEHAYDVKEALQCYSQLTNSVYLDIVDKFFIDMYCEFSRPKESASINNSRRRYGSSRF